MLPDPGELDVVSLRVGDGATLGGEASVALSCAASAAAAFAATMAAHDDALDAGAGFTGIATDSCCLSPFKSVVAGESSVSPLSVPPASVPSTALCRCAASDAEAAAAFVFCGAAAKDDDEEEDEEGTDLASLAEAVAVATCRSTAPAYAGDGMGA